MLGKRTISYIRRTVAVASATGRPSTSLAAAVEFEASVQPLNGIEIQQLPEGERSRDSRKLYTTTALRTASAGSGAAADRIVIDGANYEVHTVQPYDTMAPLPHYKVVVLREGTS